MPQNLLAKNQTPSTGLTLNSNANSTSSEQNQYLRTNPSQKKNSTFSITTSNNTNSHINSRLNQGKLLFLNEKFLSHKSENNYDELVTVSSSSTSVCTTSTSKTATKSSCRPEDACNCCRKDESQLRARVKTACESAKKKRLSCEELEGLSERFADFIKIDTAAASMKGQAPLPPPPPPLALGGDRKSAASPPLPPPPSCLVDNFDEYANNKKQAVLQIPVRVASRLSVLSVTGPEPSSPGESSLSSSSSSSASSSLGTLFL